MNSTALMLLLGLMGTVWSAPVCDPEMKLECRVECSDDFEWTAGHHMSDFKHVSDLHDSSVAPWDLMEDTQLDREPQHIDYALCRPCKVEGKTAKEIFLQVSVYEKIRNGTGVAWCKCPYRLAVGCTCVSEQ